MAAPIESDIEVFQYDCNRSDRDDEQDILIRSYELHVTLQKMFQRIRDMSHCIRNMFELTGRSCFNVALTSGKLLVRRGDNVSGRACNLLTSRKMLQRIRNVWQAT